VKYVLAGVAGYVFGWAISYTVLMGADFRYVFEYLRLAWTDPGERPTIIQFGAVAMAIVAPLTLWVICRSRRSDSGQS